MEALHWPRVGLLPVVHAIEAALREKRGFSLIRLGDGEGAVLSHDQPEMAAEVAHSLAIWFGDQALTTMELEQIRNEALEAMLRCDVVGLPRLAQANGSIRYRALFPVMQELYADVWPMVVDAAMHFYLQWSKAMGRLLSAVERVTLIGCRDLAQDLRACFNLEVRQWLVRGEAGFPGSVREQHWPDGYAAVLERITLVEPGELVLVGAGVLGKIYCGAVRRRSGVAIDVGSLLDGWAGVRSRPNRIDGTPVTGLPYLVSPDYGDDRLAAWLCAQMVQTNIADGVI